MVACQYCIVKPISVHVLNCQLLNNHALQPCLESSFSLLIQLQYSSFPQLTHWEPNNLQKTKLFTCILAYSFHGNIKYAKYCNMKLCMKFIYLWLDIQHFITVWYLCRYQNAVQFVRFRLQKWFIVLTEAVWWFHKSCVVKYVFHSHRVFEALECSVNIFNIHLISFVFESHKFTSSIVWFFLQRISG